MVEALRRALLGGAEVWQELGTSLDDAMRWVAGADGRGTLVLTAEERAAPMIWPEAGRFLAPSDRLAERTIRERVAESVSRLLGDGLLLSPNEGDEPRVRSIIDEEVTRMLTEGYERAEGIISEHRAKLDMLATALLQEEVLEEDQIARLIGPRALEGGMAAPKPFRPAVSDAEEQI